MSEAMSATATTPFSYDLYETVSRIAAEPRSSARRRMFKLSTSSNGGVFKPYAVTFPQQVRALVIEKMTYGTYSMSDTEALRALTELLTFPEKKDLINLNSLSKHPTYPKLPCIVTAAGDARISLLPYHSGVVRGILDDFLREENMCKVVLVDYGQTILCSASIVFYFTSQSSEAREAPVALFNCRISELTPRGTNGYNTVELSAGMTYEICLLRKLNNKLLAGIAIEPFSWSPVMDDVNLKGEEQQLEALHGNIDTFIKNPEGGETTIAIARKKVEEEEEALHRERIAFEQECMEREKELALAAMQMQLLDFSSRLNTVYAASQHAMSLAKNGFQNNGQRMLLPLDCRESVGIRSRRQSSLSDAASRSILFSGESLLPATAIETRSATVGGSNLTEAGSCSNRQLANADYSRYRSARTHAPVGLLESDIGITERRGNLFLRNGCFTNSSQNPFSSDSFESLGHHPTLPSLLSQLRNKSLRDGRRKLSYFRAYPSCYKCSSDGHFAPSCPIYPELRATSAPAKRVNCYVNSDTVPSSNSLIHIASDSDPTKCSTLPSSSPSNTFLKFSRHFSCISVKKGDVLTVRRCDGDDLNKSWPLFFVKILKDKMIAASAAEVEFLSPTLPCKQDDLCVGLLCIAYSCTFKRHLRAVVTAIAADRAQVFFIDRGNYEELEISELWSVDDQPDIVCRHCSLALPCALIEFDDFGCGDYERFDVDTLQEAVSCQQRSFQLRVVKQRDDGVAFVQLA